MWLGHFEMLYNDREDEKETKLMSWKYYSAGAGYVCLSV
jgi:hypothetical protein